MLPTSLINPDTCVAARATIRAAEIQAKAARSAGTETLIAGALALLASLIAVAVTYFLSKSELRRQKSEKIIRKKAYTTALSAVIYDVLAEIQGIQEFVEELSLRKDPWSKNNTLILPDALNLSSHEAARIALAWERWSDLSNLPDETIPNAVAVGMIVTRNLVYYSTLESYLHNKEENSIITNKLSKYTKHIIENKSIIDNFYLKLIEISI